MLSVQRSVEEFSLSPSRARMIKRSESRMPHSLISTCKWKRRIPFAVSLMLHASSARRPGEGQLSADCAGGGGSSSSAWTIFAALVRYPSAAAPLRGCDFGRGPCFPECWPAEDIVDSASAIASNFAARLGRPRANVLESGSRLWSVRPSY